MTERKKIIVGAWKAYVKQAQAKEITTALVEWRKNESKKSNYEIVLSPPNPYLIPVKDLINDTDISLSAQDVDAVDMGAHTGYIPPQILDDVGCTFVILGHSELRHTKDDYIKDNYKTIHLKVKAALESGLQVILCIGETDRQRVTNQTYNELKKQIETAIDNIDEKFIKNNLSIAYEPVWAISSQNPISPPSPQKINVINRQLRTLLEKNLSLEVAETVRLLYGGSVNADNVCGYLHEELVDGVLVGSVSTKLPDFINLLNAVEEKVLVTV